MAVQWGGKHFPGGQGHSFWSSGRGWGEFLAWALFLCVPGLWSSLKEVLKVNEVGGI